MSRSSDVAIKADTTPWLLTPAERAFCHLPALELVHVADDGADLYQDHGSVASDECVALAQWIDAQADLYQALGTELGAWFAGRIRAIAETARTTLASTPAELDDREESMIEDYHNHLRDQGYEAAVSHPY